MLAVETVLTSAGTYTPRNRKKTTGRVRKLDDPTECSRLPTVCESGDLTTGDCPGEPGVRVTRLCATGLAAVGRDACAETVETAFARREAGDGRVDVVERVPSDAAEFDRPSPIPSRR